MLEDQIPTIPERPSRQAKSVELLVSADSVAITDTVTTTPMILSGQQKSRDEEKDKESSVLKFDISDDEKVTYEIEELTGAEADAVSELSGPSDLSKSPESMVVSENHKPEPLELSNTSSNVSKVNEIIPVQPEFGSEPTPLVPPRPIETSSSLTTALAEDSKEGEQTSKMEKINLVGRDAALPSLQTPVVPRRPVRANSKQPIKKKSANLQDYEKAFKNNTIESDTFETKITERDSGELYQKLEFKVETKPSDVSENAVSQKSINEIDIADAQHSNEKCQDLTTSTFILKNEEPSIDLELTVHEETIVQEMPEDEVPSPQEVSSREESISSSDMTTQPPESPSLGSDKSTPLKDTPSQASSTISEIKIDGPGIPVVPVRPKKRGPFMTSDAKVPPKPNRLSSRIAAFQQMFNQPEPQLEQKKPPPPAKKWSGDTSEIASNLQSIMARGIPLPGMVKLGHMMSPNSPDKEKPELESNSELPFQEDVKDEPMLPVLRRAKGPRGKKLPRLMQESKITVEPRFKVVTAELWQLSFSKKIEVSMPYPELVNDSDFTSVASKEEIKTSTVVVTDESVVSSGEPPFDEEESAVTMEEDTEDLEPETEILVVFDRPNQPQETVVSEIGTHQAQSDMDLPNNLASDPLRKGSKKSRD